MERGNKREGLRPSGAKSQKGVHLPSSAWCDGASERDFVCPEQSRKRSTLALVRMEQGDKRKGLCLSEVKLHKGWLVVPGYAGLTVPEGPQSAKVVLLPLK